MDDPALGLWGGNGWGGFGGRGNGLSNLPAELNGDAGRQLLMNAIQGNGTAINQLATLNQTNTLTSNANTQFNALGSKIDAQTQVINDRFCALEMREMQNKLDAERAKSAALAGQLSQEHQTATIMQSQAQAVAPINAAIGDLSNRLAKIECGLPPTTVVPNPQVYAMPACVAAQYGLGFGAAFGLGGNGGFWG